MTECAVLGSDRGEDRLTSCQSCCRRWRIDKCAIDLPDKVWTEKRHNILYSSLNKIKKSVLFGELLHSSASKSAKFVWYRFRDYTCASVAEAAAAVAACCEGKFKVTVTWPSQDPRRELFCFFGERKQILTFLLMLVVVLKKGNFDAAVVVLWLNWLAHCISIMTDFWRPLIKEPVVWYSCGNSWKTIVNHRDTEDRKKVLRSNIMTTLTLTNGTEWCCNRNNNWYLCNNLQLKFNTNVRGFLLYVGYHNMIILGISLSSTKIASKRCFIFPVFLTHSNGKPYLFKADHCRSGGHCK